jgi:hypothetical protein
LEKSVELINSGETDLGVNMLFTEDAIDHDPAPGQAAGPEGFRTLFRTSPARFLRLHADEYRREMTIRFTTWNQVVGLSTTA